MNFGEGFPGVAREGIAGDAAAGYEIRRTVESNDDLVLAEARDRSLALGIRVGEVERQVVHGLLSLDYDSRRAEGRRHAGLALLNGRHPRRQGCGVIAPLAVECVVERARNDFSGLLRKLRCGRQIGQAWRRPRGKGVDFARRHDVKLHVGNVAGNSRDRNRNTGNQEQHEPHEPSKRLVHILPHIESVAELMTDSIVPKSGNYATRYLRILNRDN